MSLSELGEVVETGVEVERQTGVHTLALPHLANPGATVGGRYPGRQGKAELVVITAAESPAQHGIAVITGGQGGGNGQ